jgi:hypothetical protein
MEICQIFGVFFCWYCKIYFAYDENSYLNLSSFHRYKQIFKAWIRKAFQLWFNIGIGLEVEKIFVFVF